MDEALFDDAWHAAKALSPAELATCGVEVTVVPVGPEGALHIVASAGLLVHRRPQARPGARIDYRDGTPAQLRLVVDRLLSRRIR